MATKEFSLKPITYCFPVAGCVSYRGYFSEASAENYGEKLKEKGLDVHIRGVSAYSTLGWFDDPVLSSFVWYKEENLVNLIYHELAHKVLYVNGDTRFNESFATAVGGEGAKRWFNNKNDSAGLERLTDKNRIRARFITLVDKYKKRLDRLYSAKNLSKQEKRERKKEIFTEMVSEYEIIKTEEWDDYKGYDNWFYNNLNNAKLAGVADYNDLVPAFNAILADLDGALPQFYRRCRELADLPKEERNREFSKILR
jgi:predicted aminopeptidase